MKKILGWCAGLPIALSVSGSAVALLAENLDTLEEAFNKYATDFEARATNLGDEPDPDGSRLSDGIHLSLEYSQKEFSNWKERKAVDIKHSINDLYASLCVMTKQLWIPVSVLGRMWNLDEMSAYDVADLFCRMSLAKLSYRKIGNGESKKAGLSLHDLHLEFCQQQAKSKKLQSFWHSTLLHGYEESQSDLCSDLCGLSPLDLVELSPRPWWSDTCPDDGYIHAHLARHLSLSGRVSELAALLLDARWIKVRGKLGGLLGLQEDYDIVDKLLERGERIEENVSVKPKRGSYRLSGRLLGKLGRLLGRQRHIADQALERGERIGGNVSLKPKRVSFRLILKAIQLSWGRF